MNIAQIFYNPGLNGTNARVAIIISCMDWSFRSGPSLLPLLPSGVLLEKADRSIGTGPLRAFRDVTLPLASLGLMASAILVFLEGLDQFMGLFFVGAPDVQTMPLLLYTAANGGNNQISTSITALVILMSSILFMLIDGQFLCADVLTKVGK